MFINFIIAIASISLSLIIILNFEHIHKLFVYLLSKFIKIIEFINIFLSLYKDYKKLHLN